ncbi:hypothetical protein TNCV_638671 [Trichonephila clavipes]|nr:hypothetical protein TNCV_638671 [Trichonephila clavipes]
MCDEEKTTCNGLMPEEVISSSTRPKSVGGNGPGGLLVSESVSLAKDCDRSGTATISSEEEEPKRPSIMIKLKIN